MDRPTQETVLIRYGEIGLKGKNRALFENRLMANLRATARDGSLAAIRKTRGRILADIAPCADREEVLARLVRTFGVVSISPARVVSLEDDTIAHVATEVTREALQKLPPSAPSTFKVEARRANKDYPRTSPQINAWLGTEILESIPEARVDVHEPAVRIGVEIRSDSAYVLGRTIPGPGGLPVGSAGRGLLLMSGGIDSPVAAWQIMKRGLEIEAIHFHTPPFTGPRARRKVEELVEALAPWGVGITLHLCHFTETAVALREKCPRRLHLTIMRRLMFRQASALARELDIPVLVTGESLGQVASQTLENLVATDEAASVPVLRPLIGFDKQEIMDRARKIGTYDISIQPHEDCCSVFVPSDPKTTPALEDVLRAEALLPERFLGDTAPPVQTIAFGPDGLRRE